MKTIKTNALATTDKNICVWNEKIEFELKSETEIIQFQLLDKDSAFTNSFMGCFEIDISNLPRDTSVCKWHLLKDKPRYSRSSITSLGVLPQTARTYNEDSDSERGGSKSARDSNAISPRSRTSFLNFLSPRKEKESSPTIPKQSTININKKPIKKKSFISSGVEKERVLEKGENTSISYANFEEIKHLQEQQNNTEPQLPRRKSTGQGEMDILEKHDRNPIQLNLPIVGSPEKKSPLSLKLDLSNTTPSTPTIFSGRTSYGSSTSLVSPRNKEYGSVKLSIKYTVKNCLNQSFSS